MFRFLQKSPRERANPALTGVKSPAAHQKPRQKTVESSTSTPIVAHIAKFVNTFRTFSAILASIIAIAVILTPVSASAIATPKPTHTIAAPQQTATPAAPQHAYTATGSPRPSTPTASAAYDYNSFYFDDFTADYYLKRDADGTSRMLVVEEFTTIFPTNGKNHGIYRVIPFTNQDGKNLTMTSDETIYINVERNGVEEPIDSVIVGDGYFGVYIGDPNVVVTGEQVYTLTYEFENLVTDFGDWQELYWDTNGNDWTQRFNHVTARVHLDEASAAAFTGETSCYVGTYSSNNQARCQTTQFTEDIAYGDYQSSGGVQFTADNLKSRENLTYVLQFAPATFTMPPTRFDYKLVALTVVAVLGGAVLITLIVLARRSVRAKRHFYDGLFVKPEYTPAPDLTVAEMAANYIGKGLHGDSKVATLLELAVQHKIELVKTEKDNAIFKNGKKKITWKIRLKTDSLNKQQATVLKILAGSDTPLRQNQEIVVKSHTATSELTKLATRFTTSTETALVKKGLREPTKSTKKATAKTTVSQSSAKSTPNWTSILTVADVVWFFGWFAIGMFCGDDSPKYLTLIGEHILPFVIVIIAVGTFIAVLVTVVQTSRFADRTKKGLEMSKYLDGLKLYMTMAEADRLKFLQSVDGADTSHAGVIKLYEKLLPYAVIFKIEKSWLAELSRYYEFDDVSAPVWYFGVGAFSARDFNSAMVSASSSLANTIQWSTTSNSSSGFSGGGGGGFSGGGGGGGGGGGW